VSKREFEHTLVGRPTNRIDARIREAIKAAAARMD
jgi:hypothetical protein